MGARRHQRVLEAATAAGVALAAMPLLCGAIGSAVSTNLSFGGTARPESGGVTLTLPANTGTRTGSPDGGALGAPASSRAVIALTGGGKNDTYTVSIAASGVSIGGNAAAFSWYSLNGASGTVGRLDANGADTLYVGGTVGLSATSALGSQTASGPITVTVVIDGNGNAANRTTVATLPATGVTLRVVAPPVLTKQADLAFGTVVSGAAAGTVTVPAVAAPTPTAAGGARYMGAGASGRFSLSGQPSQAYTLAVSPSSLTLTSPEGGSMTADAFTTSTGASATLPAAGTQTIYVGGRLNVGASQPQGTYTGILTLTVAYQ